MIGCAWLAAAATFGDRQESLTFDGKSLARTYTYAVAPGTASLEIGLEATVGVGTLRGRVIDPDGRERLLLRLERGRGRGTTGRVEAIPGAWRLEIATEGARGRCLAHFSSR
jgi:hypothetical protein